MGHHNRHFAGDKYSQLGVWGPPTSTANFCEEDYVITFFIAEFVNTLTNFAYIYYAIKFPGPSPRPSPSSPSPPPRSWTRPDTLALALWALGFLSFAFHATLLHSSQYGDEIAMLILGGALLRGVWPHDSRLAPILSAAAVVASSAVYLQTANILHHVYSFYAMMLVIGARTLYLIFFRASRTSADRSRHLYHFAGAIGTLAFAYFLWHIDLEYCAQLRMLRHSLGLPFAWVLEFHGWWHILTALGASLYIRLVRDINPQ